MTRIHYTLSLMTVVLNDQVSVCSTKARHKATLVDIVLSAIDSLHVLLTTQGLAN